MSIYTFSEAELRSRFIKNIGNRDDIDVYIEVPVFCRSVDLVIQEKQNAEIFAIEFKLHDWKRAIQQAQSVGLCFDYLYICLPKPKTNSSASKISDTCISNGVGLIFYDTELNEFFIEVEASKTADVWEKERCRIVNYSIKHTAKNYDLLLLKIHGSANWLRCLNCGSISIFEKNHAATSLFEDNRTEKCPVCGHEKTAHGASMQPELITPTMMKSLSNQ